MGWAILRLATGVFVAGELEGVVRHPIADHGEWERAIQQAWSRIADGAAPAVAGASVNPQVNSHVEEIVQRLTGQGVQWVGRQIEVPIEVCTQNPSETGIDRVLNVAAAYEQMGKACIVVDAGTAVTVDCCNDNGDFLGGAIAPGLSMMLDALGERTAGVGRVSFAVPRDLAGDSTAAAVSLGVISPFGDWSRRRRRTTRRGSGDGLKSSPPAEMRISSSRAGS